MQGEPVVRLDDIERKRTRAMADNTISRNGRGDRGNLRIWNAQKNGPDRRPRIPTRNRSIHRVLRGAQRRCDRRAETTPTDDDNRFTSLAAVRSDRHQ
jgi:hypothetical protein